MQRLLFLMKFWWIAVLRPVTPMDLFHLCVALNSQKQLSSCFVKCFSSFSLVILLHESPQGPVYDKGSSVHSQKYKEGENVAFP